MKTRLLLCGIAVLAFAACGGGQVRPPVANGDAHIRALATTPPNTTADWMQFGFDQQRDSYNGVENILSVATVPRMQQKWTSHFDNNIFAQPLLLHAVTISGSTRPVLYVASFFHLLAIDANASTGTSAKVLWNQTLPSTTTSCAGSTVHNGAWATPYIDKASQRIYLVDGARNLDAYNIVTGTRIYSTAIPISYVNGGVDGALSFDPTYGRLFIATTLRCGFENDASTPMRGQIVSYTASTGARLGSFTAVTSSGYYGGGIWGMGGVSIDPTTHALFAASGNSWPASTTTAEHTNYAEHVIQLSSALQVTASNYPGVGGNDKDFGAAPTLFQPSGCPPMAALSNKDGELLVYNRSSISSGPIIGRITMSNPVPGDFINAPAFDPATQMLYETSSTDSTSGLYKHGLTAFNFVSCKPQRAWNVSEGTVGPTNTGDVYSSPTVVNGVVYFGAGKTDVVYANDARTGALLWKSPLLSGVTQISPMVVNGRLYVVAGGSIYAFGL